MRQGLWNVFLPASDAEILFFLPNNLFSQGKLDYNGGMKKYLIPLSMRQFFPAASLFMCPH
uniref:Uncharacterized protein n=1 Tax=Neisseria meningitidis alpha275 TaxID=295996 RepID=C6SKL4_NEIME|nr:hypothetical protein NMW_1485 [Neisseria meningitidis alpha275]